MSLKDFAKNNKKVLLLSGILIIAGLLLLFILVLFNYSSLNLIYFLYFDILIGLPLYISSILIDFFRIGDNNIISLLVVLIGVIANLIYIFFISKGIIYLKNKLNKKIFFSLIIVVLFFLLSLDYPIGTKLHKPDIYCNTDADCVSTFNKYSSERCDYLCHNINWNYYKPLISNVLGSEPCPPPPQCICIQNKCQAYLNKK